jgi:hypothetical protein
LNELTQERFADAMRRVAERTQEAVAEEHELEADLKRRVAQLKVSAEHEGYKSAIAQDRQADLSDEVHGLRVQLGVARSKVAALRLEAKRVEIAFDVWRTKQASERAERRAYGA